MPLKDLSFQILVTPVVGIQLKGDEWLYYFYGTFQDSYIIDHIQTEEMVKMHLDK